MHSVQKTNQKQVITVVGCFFGDEGKGKIVDKLCDEGDFSVVARVAGGSNSAHTISIGGKKFIPHLIPSGLFSEKMICLMGNGMVIDLAFLFEEMEILKREFDISIIKRLRISDRAHIVFPFHKKIDFLIDKRTGVRTTCQGIGPCYSDKISRRGIRISDLTNPQKFTERYWKMVEFHLAEFPSLSGEFDFTEILRLHLEEYAPKLESRIVDCSAYIYQSITSGQKILVECSQAVMLDIDHGFYPYVTSSSTSSGGAVNGLGIAPSKISTVGVVKAIITRVASPGKLPTEFSSEDKKNIISWTKVYPDIQKIPEIPKAGGTLMNSNTVYPEEDVLISRRFMELDASGRPRICGWFDCVLLKRANILNDFSYLCLNKLDCLTGLKKIKICVGYFINGHSSVNNFTENPDDVEYVEIDGWDKDISTVQNFKSLPEQAKNFINIIEKCVDVPIKYIGIGPDRDQILVRD
ncbi:adenylosuccinate synthetase [Megavirus chiliensis]|uniref:Adenylosuccinate synthetase n=2 Tax=Megamimivirinae TaxID=3044648 RepID=A0A2L2DP28_MIMIV|nr:2-aminooxy adenylosuccinate synthetase [Megavirus chiliensis]AEQ32480.1 adenylosuccinate synthetase [Megavirus chiliensis]AVG47928.1 adenylosuccinate synthetase [Acanthamoeba polyphaga mimivirus]